MKKRYTLLLGLMALGFFANAQYDPQYRQPVTITEPFGSAITDYAALLIVDTQTPIGAGQMQATGDDIRFTSGCANDQAYDYWIESGINTTATRIWVRIPQLTSNETLTLQMFYGDPAAAAVSGFSTAFPNALITSGNSTMTGVQNVGWLHVQAGDTIFITGGSPVEFIASYAKIDGVIMAQGSGYAVTGLSATGAGPGGGTPSATINSGSGGGSHAGIGGTGGYDAGDSPGTGGVVYGSTTNTMIDMGSAGGSSDNTLGGNGGGAVTIKGVLVYVNGSIDADGNDGEMPGGSRGGGGGAGGGVIIMADSVVVSGTVSAKGGAGSIGTISANDSGGGGGGGLIKLFSDAGITVSGTTDVTGGAGGPYGGVPAQAGGAGSSNTLTWTFAEPTMGTAGAVPMVSYTETSGTLCDDGAAITLTAGTPAGGTYSGTGVTGNNFDPVVAGAGTHNIVYTYTDNGCNYTDTSSIDVDVCTGIAAEEASLISIYPNPASDNVKVINTGNADAVVELFNTAGQVVISAVTTSSEINISVASLSPGIYMARITAGDKTSWHRISVSR